MMLGLMRYSLIAAVVISAARAGLAAIPSGPMEPAAIDDNVGTIRIEGNRAAAAGQVSRGNPLWAIPLKDLSATRERPIFSPLRRPPAPVVATAPYAPSPPVKPAEPERPQLSLVGTIAGGTEGFGIFVDRLANTVLRLKTGEQHKGWILREVRGRETVLEKGDKTTTLALPVLPSAAPVRQGEGEKDLKRSKR
jgi:hypothetical protein